MNEENNFVVNSDVEEARLHPVNAKVPLMFKEKKDHFGVSWVLIIREGLKALELQEKLMNERVNPKDIDWRTRSREQWQELRERMK